MKTKTIVVCCICAALLAMGLLGGCGGPAEEAATPGNAQPSAPAGEETQKTLETTANEFIKAFFAKDTERIKGFLTDTYEWDVCVYKGSSSAVCDTALKGLDNQEIGDSCTLSYEFRADSDSDTYTYLTMEFVKVAEGWKVSFYGLEG